MVTGHLSLTEASQASGPPFLEVSSHFPGAGGHPIPNKD